MNNLEEVMGFLKANIKQTETIVLGLSGGLDSMVLFDILKNHNYSFVVAHVNHKKREASDKEYEAIKALSNNAKVPFEGIELSDLDNDNFQDEARQKRLDFFSQVAQKYHTKKILLAHHLDDQIETFLMKFFKGSPLYNLAPIDPITTIENITIYRPLLMVKKSVLLDYAKTHQIMYYHDASNDLDLYTRNRYRNTIIPVLRTEQSNLDQLIQTRLDEFTMIHELIEDNAQTFLNHNPLSVQSFNTLNPLVKERVLKILINKHTLGKKDLSKALIKQLITLLSNHESNLTYPINSSIKLHIEYDRFFIGQASKPVSKIIQIDKEGTYEFDTCKSYIVTHDKSSHISSKYVVLCYNSKVFPLSLRTRAPKDKIHLPFGHKKIKDLLIDKKIAPSLRNQIVLLTNHEEVLWIPSLNMQSESFKDGTKKLYIYEVNKC
jgi:tRNA(Ile)-lysidine synthetase-like protein